MNNERRKAIKKLAEDFEANIKGKLEDLQTEIEAIKDEEQEYKDNIPESMQDGDKAQTAENAINALEECLGMLDGMVNEFVGHLSDAQD